MSSDSDSGVLVIVGYIYLFISQIMTLYYWWDWAQDHGFWSCVFIGPLVAEFKGLLWIFFIL